MAVLNSSDLNSIQRGCEGKINGNYTKAQLNLAAQATEDWFEANRAGISTAINVATAPLVFTNAQKKQIVAHWLLVKFGKEKV